MSYHSDLDVRMKEARPMHFDDCECSECRIDRSKPWLSRKMIKREKTTVDVYAVKLLQARPQVVLLTTNSLVKDTIQRLTLTTLRVYPLPLNNSAPGALVLI